jgi:phage N-6-adenine-methyltransferase
MKSQSVLFSRSTHETDKWATPQKYFDLQDKKYRFVFDLACSASNCKTRDGFTEETDSLDQDWSMISKETRGGWLWLNPPYSNVKGFIDKCYFESTLGARIVCLVPARTDTFWFHEFVYNQKGVSIEFIRGRLIFGTDQYWEWVWEQEILNDKPNSLYKQYGKKNSAPFPSMQIIFDRNPDRTPWDIKQDVKKF